jgi:hypothetical protein
MNKLMLALAGTVMLAGLGGCDGPSPGAAPTASASPDPVEAKIRALNTNMRRLAFFRAVYDSGYACKEITDDQELPRDAGRARWKATCDDGREFFVTLQPGGTFIVSGPPAPTGPRFKSIKPQATPPTS